MRTFVPAIWIAALASWLFGATGPAAFDVASVKPNKTIKTNSSTSRSGGRITLENVSLRETISVAFDIPSGRDYALSGPAWLGSEKFDIVATCPPETSRERVHEMLRTLLAQRFGLKTHRESRRLTTYALVVSKQGPALTASNDGAEENLTFGEGRIIARAMSMAALADRLSGPIFKLERPVMDMTGIKGAYDFTLKWAPDGATLDGGSAASIFTALQEQLGLKLEARESTVEILIVDHAERIPTGN